MQSVSHAQKCKNYMHKNYYPSIKSKITKQLMNTRLFRSSSYKLLCFTTADTDIGSMYQPASPISSCALTGKI